MWQKICQHSILTFRKTEKNHHTLGQYQALKAVNWPGTDYTRTDPAWGGGSWPGPPNRPRCMYRPAPARPASLNVPAWRAGCTHTTHTHTHTHAQLLQVSSSLTAGRERDAMERLFACCTFGTVWLRWQGRKDVRSSKMYWILGPILLCLGYYPVGTTAGNIT